MYKALIRSLLLLALVLVAESSAAKGTARRKKKVHSAQEKLKCKSRELELRDCGLETGKLKVHLYHDKWRFDDSIELATEDMPLPEEGVTWKAAELNILNGRRLLQMWLWSKPAGEPGVETLNWFVLEITGPASPIRVHEIVRRRRQIVTGNVGPAAHPKFQYDPEEKHGLSLSHGKIKWFANRRHGEF